MKNNKPRDPQSHQAGRSHRSLERASPYSSVENRRWDWSLYGRLLRLSYCVVTTRAPKRFSPSQLPGGRDLVDEAVVERLARVEIAPTPRVFRDLLGGPARAPGKAPVEPPQQLLLLATLRGNFLRGASKPRRRLREVKPRVRCGGTVIGCGDHANGWAADLTPAKDAQRRAQRAGSVDQDEDRPERAVGAVQVDLDGPVPLGVQRQERGRCLRRGIVVEPTGDDHDASLEELLLEPT